MLEMVVGPDAADVVDLDAPIADNLRKVAKAKGKHVSDRTVIMLDRDRHEEGPPSTGEGPRPRP